MFSLRYIWRQDVSLQWCKGYLGDLATRTGDWEIRSVCGRRPDYLGELACMVLHRVRLHLKVPGWLSGLNALLTRKLPMLFGFGIIGDNLKILRMTFLTAGFCGW